MAKKNSFSIKKLLKQLGPGFITGASDDDPSGIATYSQTGAQFGYSQLWVMVLTLPFMIAIQALSARIALVTGKGIAKIIKDNYSVNLLYILVGLLAVANIVNIGADLGAMASSVQLLVDVPFWPVLIFIAIVIVLLQVFVPYKRYANLLKYLTLSLFAYIAVVFIIKQDWQQVFINSALPNITLNRDYVLSMVALLGTTISPYLFFWQANEEIEEEIAEHKLPANKEETPKISERDIQKMRIDTIFGMSFSNIIAISIVITAASTLHLNGIIHIQTASQAAEALRPFAGNLTFLLFAAGIIGTGFLAVPILAGATAYAVSETFGWRTGLFRKFKAAPKFYWVIIISSIIGVFINLLPIKPFELLYYTAVINGLASPPLMIMLILIANSKKVMGQRTTSLKTTIAASVITLIMGISAVLLIGSLFIR